MIAAEDRLSAEDIIKAEIITKLEIPFFSSYVQAGFPSPAENWLEKVCDLNDLCIDTPEATYFVRVISDSMIGDRIDAGDILVVDSSKVPADGKIVVVWLNGDHAVKRIKYAGKMVVLHSSNPKYLPIYVHPEQDDFKILGVVTNVIFKPM
ncbi:hypothetical protein GCM10023189_37680 [Nibrella saemangeumensis]|uniref:Peptidase S24/S26A/S26B/S26C domain-containing protein n=1 Tax=Nibrella saemangeumensis TaxID=1084526 RepID=A0ABP8N8I2_9BACT